MKQVYLSDETHAILKGLAKQKGMIFSKLVEQIIGKFLEENNKKEKK